MKSLLLIIIALSVLTSGCATIGSRLAYQLAKEEEEKGCKASYISKTHVDIATCERISRLIKKAGISGGYVGYDSSGRIRLKGDYLDEDQVDTAFLVAITVVGVSSLDISPVTPRNVGEIKMYASAPADISDKSASEKLALLVGVSKFKNKINPIVTATKDVVAIENILKRQGFKKIVTLLDEEATKLNILSKMDELRANAKPDDIVFVYISTHGTPPDTFGKLGIIPYDLDSPIKQEDLQSVVRMIQADETGDAAILKIVKDRKRALKTAISFDDLQDFLSSVKSRDLVAVLDTCYSGGALGALSLPVGGAIYAEKERTFYSAQSEEAKSEMIGDGKLCNTSGYGDTQAYQIGFSYRNQSMVSPAECTTSSTKGLEVTPEALTSSPKQSTPVPDKDYEMLEKLRRTFGVDQSSGRVLITATSGNEKSRFDPSLLPQSYFTYYLTTGLEHSGGKVFDAFDYAQVRTRKLVSDTEACGITQTPKMVSSPAACLNFSLKNSTTEAE
jgi:hypothetical protein